MMPSRLYNGKSKQLVLEHNAWLLMKAITFELWQHGGCDKESYNEACDANEGDEVGC